MLEFVTEKGKEILELMGEFGLLKWYDMYVGNVQIPKSEYPQAKKLVDDFLKANKGWAMIFEEYNDDDMEDMYFVCEKEDLEEF